jgi:hypothetical protein
VFEKGVIARWWHCRHDTSSDRTPLPDAEIDGQEVSYVPPNEDKSVRLDVRQGEQGSSLKEQRDAITNFATRQGLHIGTWFEERETAEVAFG